MKLHHSGTYVCTDLSLGRQTSDGFIALKLTFVHAENLSIRYTFLWSFWTATL